MGRRPTSTRTAIKRSCIAYTHVRSCVACTHVESPMHTQVFLFIARTCGHTEATASETAVPRLRAPDLGSVACSAMPSGTRSTVTAWARAASNPTRRQWQYCLAGEAHNSGVCHPLPPDLEASATRRPARPTAVFHSPLTSPSTANWATHTVFTTLRLHYSHCPQGHAAKTTCG